MPNWVTNKLTIQGKDSSKIMKSLLILDEDKEYRFDFNKITPMPEDLNIISGSLTERSIELYLTLINPDIKHFGSEHTDYDFFEKQKKLAYQGKRFGEYREALSQEQIDEIVKTHVDNNTFKDINELIAYGKKALSNIEKYGAKDWYSWSIEHWGTKWNACQNFYDIENSPSEIVFDTAWSNVADLIAKLSTIYPKNEFHLEFAEEWIGNQCGNLIFQNGEIIAGKFYEDGSKEAYEQAFKLWGEDLKENFIFDENKKNLCLQR